MRQLFVIALASVSLLSFAHASSGCLHDLVKYENQTYCPGFDRDVWDATVERGKMVTALNAMHELVVQTSKVSSENLACVSRPLSSRQDQLACLQNLYYLRGTISAELTASAALRAKVVSLKLSDSVKADFAVNAQQFESSANKMLAGVQLVMQKAERDFELAVTQWISKQTRNARNEGINRTFCAGVSADAELAAGKGVAISAAIRIGDTFAAQTAYLNLREALAMAKYSYKICGSKTDASFSRLALLNLSSAKLIKSMSVLKNFKKVCADPSVTKWPKLSKACRTEAPNQELLASLHNALTSTTTDIRYSEEK